MRFVAECRTRLATPAGVAGVAVLTAWVYWGSLHAPFHFDDSLFLDSPQVSSPGNFSFLARPGQTRPIAYLTFYWNYLLGGTNPEGYHLVNLLLHLANVFLIGLFVRLLTIEGTGASSPTVHRLLPTASAAVFALHPVQSEPVNYVYQRSTLLAAFFCLCAMILYLWSERAPGRRRYRVLAVISWILAAASKESAWVLPLVAFAWLWSKARDFSSLRDSLLRSRGFAAVSTFLMISGVGWTCYCLRKSGDRTIGASAAGDSLRYLVSQLQVFATYLRLLIWPSGLSVDHDFTVRPYWSLYGFCCLLLLLGVLAGTFLAHRRNPTAAFLGAAFIILLLPTSSVPPSADLLFEHRLYLPMIAASVLMAWAVLSVCTTLAKSEGRRQAVCVAVLGVLVAGCSAASRERTYVWEDNIRLWQDAVAKAPGKARPHYNLGEAYLTVDVGKAQKEFLEVTRLSPNHPGALYNLGWIDQSLGRYSSARDYYVAALASDSENWRARQNLANLDVLQGRIREALAEYGEVIRVNPDYWPAYQSLAALQIREGDSTAALAVLRKLKELRPDLLEARYLGACALVESKRFADAEAELRSLQAANPSQDYRLRIDALRRQLESGRNVERPAKPGR